MHHALDARLKLNRLCHFASLCVEHSKLKRAQTEDHLLCHYELDDRVWSLVTPDSVHFSP